jgi:hypothetical protein
MPRATLCLSCGRPFWPYKKGRCPECQSARDKADFYQSQEWKRIAKEARRRGGNECAVCGSRGRLIVHHKRARKEGGPDVQENFVLLCASGAIGMSWDSCHNAYEADKRTGKDTELRRIVEAL